ncbi:MAG: carbohydrate binding family 9 domain-containing protein [Gammaproteobacteria bacterium]|nr:carbohydrate binding family 9 domain-containing protein [Gammaproteobacteria bacterium]
MHAHKLETTPVIDGIVVGDEAWSGATPATGFQQVQPNDGQPSSQETEVYIGYSDTSLYIGVVAHDDNPAGIIVTDSRRDSNLQDTDAFLVIIDGLLDRQNGFMFGTNAAGIEYDAQITKEGSGDFGSGGGAFNLNWDSSWTVKSKIGDHGWSAEFEIPFRTLRYGSGDVQDWGINFRRNIRRNNEVAYWSPLDRNRSLQRVSEAGTLKGIEPPAQRNLQFTPYVLSSVRRGGGLTDTETDSDVGFDAKYSVTPSLTLDLTYNTDFAQVEADEQQLNLDRFALFFPEKRPFFLENAGQFGVGNGGEVELFFSRRIGISDEGAVIPVDGGARLSGKVGERTNVGLLYMSTDSVAGFAPGNNFAVARVSQELSNRSSIGAIYVGRDGDGSFLTPESDDYNRSYAVDGTWGIGDNVLLKAWAAKSDTPGLTGDDNAYSVSADYNTSTWSTALSVTEVGEDFNPEVGFLSRTDYRKISGRVLRRVRPADTWGLLELRPHISYTGYWKPDGFQESGFLHIDNHFEFRTGTELHTGVNFTKAGVIDAFEIVDGVTVQPGTYDHGEVQIVYFTNQSKPVSFNLRTTVGGRFGGDRVSLRPTIRYRIGETFRSELTYVYNDFDLPVPNGDFTANLARLRLSYSFTPSMQLQALIQYNENADTVGTNVRFSWLRNANSGLYLVYNEVDERFDGAPSTGREFILKYSHIFDLLN